MLDLSGFQVLFILFSLLWSVTVCWLGILFSLTKGPVGKDTSCRWIIDDAPLFSVCVLWFYVLWFKGPKQCIYWNLIAGVKSAQRTICVLRFLYPNPEISACLEKAKCNMTFTLNNPRERGVGGTCTWISKRLIFSQRQRQTHASITVIHRRLRGVQDTPLTHRHDGLVTLCQQQQADKSKDGNEGPKPWP